MSIIFGLCSALPLLNLLYDLTTTSLVGSFLVDMYNSDENKADLLLLPLIKPLFTVIRHFPDFVIFLLFYNLAKKKINKGIVLGLVSATAVQFLFTMTLRFPGRNSYLGDTNLILCFFYEKHDSEQNIPEIYPDFSGKFCFCSNRSVIDINLST